MLEDVETNLMDDRSWIEKLIGVVIRDSNEGYPKVRNLPTRAFSWLKTATTTFTFKTLLRHYAKRALTPRSLNVKLGPRRNYHKGGDYEPSDGPF